MNKKEEEYNNTEKINIILTSVLIFIITIYGFFVLLDNNLIDASFLFNIFIGLSIINIIIFYINTRINLKYIYTLTYLILFILTILGFYLVTQDGILDKTIKNIFIVFATLNIILPIITLSDITAKIKWYYSFLFNPRRSIVHQLYTKDKNNIFLKTINKINSNYLLSFLFWLSLFSIIVFIGNLVAPQSALGLFIQSYVFPVRTQSTFLSLQNNEFFFVIFPASSETGALVFLISTAQSILTFILSFISTFFISLISLFLIGIFFSGIFWQIIHRTVSAGRELDTVGHFIFGAESGFLTILTGQWTPALALHIANLTFWYIRTLGYNELRNIGFLIVSILILITILIFTISLEKKKK